MRYPFLKSLDISDEAGFKVSLNLDRIVRGNTDVLVSPLATKVGPEELVNGWTTIYNSNKTKLDIRLLQIEEEQQSKYGPRSVAIPWSDRSSGVDSYFSPEVSTIQDPAPLSLPPRLRPMSLDQGISFLKNSTNSGLPFVTRKGDVKEQLRKNFPELLKRQDPCLLFTRTQEQNKTRNVWGYPIADTLNEMLFYRPLLEYQKKLPWRSALFSPERVDSVVTNMIKSCTKRDKYLVSIDFSTYDATVKNRLQQSAFGYISGLFQKQYSDDISYIAERFNKIGLITPEGVRQGSHGVSSGSTFTNEVDSIAQFLIARDFGIAESDMCIQGDDGLYIVDDADKLFNHFEKFGLVVNQDKSYVSKTNCQFLQNYYSPLYLRNNIIGGIYPTYRALSRIAYLERFTNISDTDISGADYFSIRAISILENCRNHPLSKELVKYIYQMDKYNLSFSEAGLSEYIRRNSETTGTEDIFNYRYGDDIKGIKKFETFKLLQQFESGRDI
jgi:hypothetical protein